MAAIVDRVRKLLAQAENTPFPDEAKAFSEKAARLMDEHSISETLVQSAAASHGERTAGEPVQRHVLIHRGPYQGPREQLARRIADTKNVKHVSSRWDRRHGKDVYPLHLVGFPDDIDFVEMLYTSLLVQATNELNSDAMQERRKAEGAHKVAWTNAFMLGYVDEIARRLSAQRREAEQVAADHAAENADADDADDARTGVALALADREKTVYSAYKERFPKTSSTRSSAGQGSGAGLGARHGREAGRRADLGGRKVGRTAELSR